MTGRLDEGATVTGSLASINVSDGGVPKARISAARVTASGVEGDRQADLEHHGGSERAVSIFSLDRIEALRSEGHPIDVGTTGENLTVRGIDWRHVVPGAALLVGPVRLRITSYAAPCATIEASFLGRGFARISQKIHPGWSRVYARVEVEGSIRVDDPVRLGP